MIISLWGTRGSLPTPGPETTFYGGNTSCVSIFAGDSIVILDAGSGIRRLGASLQYHKRIDILLTHLHMDHIQGLGFFPPLYDPNTEIHIWGSAGTTRSLGDRLMRYLSPPLFPVGIRELPCKLFLHEIARENFQIGNLDIHSDYVCHPSPTLGFRINQKGKIFTYIPDHEPILVNPNFQNRSEWTSGLFLAKDSDLLIHDCQYTPEEYAVRVGWGHSSIEHALEFATLAHTRHMLLFHHDPSHSDADLRNIYRQYIDGKSLPFEVELAVEGTYFEL